MDHPEQRRRERPQRPRSSVQTARPVQQSAPQRTPNPRRRKVRKPPIRALCICAAVIFLVGFLLGFLIRGFFLPKDQPDESQPVAAKPPVQTTPETTAPPETTTPPAIQPDDWRLVLVNSQNLLPEGFQVNLTKLANGMQVDKRCYADLQAMISDCKAAGLSPVIASAYRSLEEQTELHESRVRRFQGEGLAEAEARKKAAQIVAIAGASEHHLGLAVDIVDMNYQTLDEGQEKTAVQQWLMEHCWEYGFILRYPEGSTKSTGIIYEPWHYRYVGTEYAAQIKDSKLCLEDWLAKH